MHGGLESCGHPKGSTRCVGRIVACKPVPARYLSAADPCLWRPFSSSPQMPQIPRGRSSSHVFRVDPAGETAHNTNSLTSCRSSNPYNAFYMRHVSRLSHLLARLHTRRHVSHLSMSCVGVGVGGSCLIREGLCECPLLLCRQTMLMYRVGVCIYAYALKLHILPCLDLQPATILTKAT